jgi:hypothetical protein
LMPLRVAVTMTFNALFTVPVEAVKFALLWPAATVTLAGTVTAAFPLAKDTEVALVAALFNVTVQLLLALLLNDDGEQASDVSCGGGATKLMLVVCVMLFALAVMVAL